MKHNLPFWSVWLNGLLYTSLFAATCASSMVLASEKLYLGEIPEPGSPLHRLVFGSTLLIYNLHFLLRRPGEDPSPSEGWTRNYLHWHRFFLVLGALMAAQAALSLSWELRLWALGLGLVSLAYSFPLIPLRGGMRIREQGIIKILVLTLVWTLVTAVLPLVYWKIPLLAYPFELAIRSSLLFTLCLAFDLRDLKKDQAQGIHTLPYGLGKERTHQLMNLGIALFLLFSFIQYFRHPQLFRLLSEILCALTTRWVLIYSQKHPGDRVYLGLVDGMMLLYSAGILATASL